MQAEAQADSATDSTLATRKATLIAAARYRRHSYGANHPLAIPRVSLTLDLIRAFGALSPEEELAGRKATVRAPPRLLLLLHGGPARGIPGRIERVVTCFSILADGGDRR
ncbi:MAG: hypothetical protein P8Y53_25070, partial [Pseudolabrys sp.]